MLSVDRHRARFEAALAGATPPHVALVERALATPPALADVASAVAEALRAVELPRGRVAVGVGSRGIARLPEFVAAVVRALRDAGAEPFVVPAMGSHGASTAQGQADVLAHLGVTEATAGAPVLATMATVRVGTTPGGVPVYLDAIAAAADAIVAINRVKPHTSFRGEIESGPAKMLAIGFGKADGARSVHAPGWGAMAVNVPAAAQAVLDTGKVAFALAILENAHERPCAVEAIPASALLARERELLVRAKALLPRLPFERIDVLVVDRVGKSVSGGGADPNVTGRWPQPLVTGGPDVVRSVYLAMTEDSDGNGNGIGLCDVVAQELADRWDPLPTYLNALTTTAAGNARLPMVMPTRDLAVRAALRMCPSLEPADAALVRIADTLHLERMWLSRAALELLAESHRVLRGFAPMDLSDGYAAGA